MTYSGLMGKPNARLREARPHNVCSLLQLFIWWCWWWEGGRGVSVRPRRKNLPGYLLRRGEEEEEGEEGEGDREALRAAR